MFGQANKQILRKYSVMSCYDSVKRRGHCFLFHTMVKVLNEENILYTKIFQVSTVSAAQHSPLLCVIMIIKDLQFQNCVHSQQT